MRVLPDWIDLSIIIPAFNEAQRILPTLVAAGEILDDLARQGRRGEVIVVCDGCQDNTEQVVTSQQALPGLRVISYEQNIGKGHAVKVGILASHGQYVAFLDADGSTPVSEITRLLPLLDGGRHDGVIGSRYTADAELRQPQPLPRRLLGRLFRTYTRLSLGLPFTDTQCGFKMFRGDLAKGLFLELECTGFGFDVELLVRAQRRGARIVECGVEWHDDLRSKVNPLRDGWGMLLTVWHLRTTVGRTLRDPVHVQARRAGQHAQ